MVARVCFITAIYGAYESKCMKYTPQTIPTDFICFTDDANITSNGWIIDSTPYHLENKCPFDDGKYLNSIVNNKHTFNIGKYYKQAFQNIPRLRDYDAVVWIDGSIEITNEKTGEYILSTIEQRKIIGWNHEYRNGMMSHEVIMSFISDKYVSTSWNNQSQPFQDISKQYNDYILDDFDYNIFKTIIPNNPNIGIWVTCFVAFANKSDEVTAFLNMWYLQTLVYSTQDQISFPYVCLKNGLIPYTLPDSEIKGDRPHWYTDLYTKHVHG